MPDTGKPSLPVAEYAPGGGSTIYVVLLASVAALGGLLFGYDTAVISGAIGFLQKKFLLNDLWKGWAASCALVGCMIGASIAGPLSDRLGRKKALLLSAILFAVSAIGTAIPQNLTQFVAARVLTGIGVGMASMLSPLYIAEVSPARIRGRLVSMNQLAIVSGILIVYFVNALVARMGDDAWNVQTGWRWMFAAGVLPAGVFLLLLFAVPESPRWLAKQGHVDRALAVLTRVGGLQHARAELAEIQDAIAHEEGSIGQLLLPVMRIPLIIGIGLAVLQQVTGINTVFYYGPEILKKAGLETADALWQNVLVGVVNTASTVIAIWVVDRLGRRPLLLLGSAGMGVSLVLMALALEMSHGLVVLVPVLAYVAAFGITLGPVVWVVIAEIFPTRIRGRAMGIATVCLWISCFLVSQFFPYVLAKLSGYGFLIYAAMCVVSFFFVLRYVPETKGKSLEEIERTWLKHESEEVGRE
jgi:MFS transporter, SP family, arabinose:H+ symporter